MKIVFTVCNRDQLKNALCLGKSFLSFNPDYKFFIGWAESAPVDNLPDWVETIEVNSLTNSPWKEMADKYYTHEFLAALKPFFIQELVHNYPEFEELIYLSPTTFILGPIDRVLDRNSFLQLTPHRTQPIDESPSCDLDDKRVLNIGMFTSGAIILHPSEQIQSLVSWWKKRAIDRHYLDLCNGMAMDQLWLNYAPAYFKDVSVIQQGGWHLGLHSAIGTTLNLQNEGYMVNDVPLISVEFAGVTEYHPIWSDHSKLITNDKNWTKLRNFYSEQCAPFEKFDSFSGVSYGKKIKIKRYRSIRKKVVKALTSVISSIEHFDLTHNN